MIEENSVDKTSHWDAPIEVGKSLIDLLSGRIYRSMPIAIREIQLRAQP